MTEARLVEMWKVPQERVSEIPVSDIEEFMSYFEHKVAMTYTSDGSLVFHTDDWETADRLSTLMNAYVPSMKPTYAPLSVL